MILWPQVESTGIYETDYSFSFCRDATARLTDEIPLLASPETPMGELLPRIVEAGDDRVLIVNDPEIVISRDAVDVLQQVMTKTGAAIVAPVYNQSSVQAQVSAPEFPYVDVPTFVECSRRVREKLGDVSRETRTMDTSCFLVSLPELRNLGSGVRSRDIVEEAKGLRLVAEGAFVHRFGNYYDSERPDLVELVPPGARKILDVGCARGGYGRLLKNKRPETVVVGVELNPVMAREAESFYDQIVSKPLEDAELESDFDCANVGDVLEHLMDPWTMLKKINSHLKPGGCVIGSTPNAGHWSIVKGLLEDRLSYVPVGLLCVSHIRFFTESSLRELLDQAGFSVDYFSRDVMEPTPDGCQFIRTVVAAGIGQEELLRTNEFVFRATKA